MLLLLLIFTPQSGWLFQRYIYVTSGYFSLSVLCCVNLDGYCVLVFSHQIRCSIQPVSGQRETQSCTLYVKCVVCGVTHTVFPMWWIFCLKVGFFPLPLRQCGPLSKCAVRPYPSACTTCICHVSIVCGSTCCMKSFVGISSCSCRGAQATLHQCQSWVELGSDMVGVGCMDIV